MVRHYAIVDGGINHLNYYGQAMAMKQPYCTQTRYIREMIRMEGDEEQWNLMRFSLYCKRCDRKAFSIEKTTDSVICSYLNV